MPAPFENVLSPVIPYVLPLRNVVNTKLKELWDELGEYQQIPTCTCLKDFNFSKYQEAEKVHKFLMGLDQNQFGTVRTNILALEPLPNLNKVYSMVLREERQQRITSTAEPKVEGATFKASATRSRAGTRPRCTHCQKPGHDRNQCFEFIGYPGNGANRRTNRGQNRLSPVQVRALAGIGTNFADGGSLRTAGRLSPGLASHAVGQGEAAIRQSTVEALTGNRASFDGGAHRLIGAGQMMVSTAVGKREASS